ncbi:MAG: sensor histidine kinase, partial [Myxococcota bacterium]
LDEKRQREFTENILRQADTLNHFVSALNQIEEIESGVMMLRRSPIQMRDLLEEALVTVRPRFEERGLDLERRFDDGADLPVQVDPEKIRQVLVNILDNALKLTPRGGRIRVSIERKAEVLEVGVHDTGPGILPEYLEHVFERFKQVDAASGNHGGLGIGLSLVKSIVELHGGRAWAESPGRLSREGATEAPGTSLYFTIPLKTAHAEIPKRDAA